MGKRKKCWSPAFSPFSTIFSWVRVFRINPDFRIFACPKFHFSFIFPIEIAKFEGFQDFCKILLAPMYFQKACFFKVVKSGGCMVKG